MEEGGGIQVRKKLGWEMSQKIQIPADSKSEMNARGLKASLLMD